MHVPSWHPDIALADLRDPPGPPGRRRGAAARQGPGDAGAAARRPACTWPAATTTWPGPPPGAGLRGRRRRPAAGRRAARPCWSTPSWRRATSTPPATAASELPTPHRRRRRRRRLPGAGRRRAGAGCWPPAATEPAAVGLARGGGRRARRRPLPWLRATLLLELARPARRRPATAPRPALDAKAAAAVLAPLDVVARRRPTPRCSSGWPRRRPPAAPAARRSLLGATAGGGWRRPTADRVRLPDTKGLRYLAELVARAGVERHVLDLVDRVEGVAADRRRRTGARSATPASVLDGRARTAYRRRIEELRAEIDDALEAGPLETAEAVAGRARPARRPAGPGLRPRRPGPAGGVGGRAGPPQRHPGAAGGASPSSTEALPAAGAALDRRVRTGLYCAYEPADDDEVRWIVQSGLNGIGAALNAKGAWNTPCTPTVDEIADGIYRISTWVPDVSPDGFTFNQFLVVGDEPLLFHTGHARHVPAGGRGRGHGACRSSRCAGSRFGHVEADECGAMNMWLAAAPGQPGRPRRARLRHLAERPLRPAAPRARRGRGASTSAASGSARSPRRTCPTAGRPRSCSRRRPARCCAATCSARSAPGRRSPPTTSSSRRWPPRRCSTPRAWRPHTGADAARPRRPRARRRWPSCTAPSFQGDGKRALYDLAAAYEELAGQN